MGFKVERADKSATLEITVDKEKYEKSIQSTIKKLGKQVNIPGFRKGKAPRHILERYLGREYVLDEAAQPLIGPAYYEALDEADLDPIASPEVDIVELGEELVFTAKIQLPPEVQLGQYLELSVNQEAPEIEDEQVEEELNRRQEAHARIVVLEPEDAAVNNDIVNIDFSGYKDGIAFEGGSGEDFNLQLGSGTFIPGFEEQMIGTTTGDDVEVELTFPEDYHEEALRGQPVVFYVKVNSIKRKELVALDDEFAKDISEFDTLEELRADIKNTMVQNSLARFNQDCREEVIRTAVANSAVDIPEVMIDDRYQKLKQDTQANMEKQGITLELYCQYFGMDIKQLEAEIKTSAEEAVKTELVFDAIAEAESIACSEEDFIAEMGTFAQAYKTSVEDLMKGLRERGDLRGMRKSMNRDRVRTFLFERNLPELLRREAEQQEAKQKQAEQAEADQTEIEQVEVEQAEADQVEIDQVEIVQVESEQAEAE
ncbi:MAG: trigger factor [Peptococcaceae bacterium]|nr:trigger factor [Peptococcaceae bacterium]